MLINFATLGIYLIFKIFRYMLFNFTTYRHIFQLIFEIYSSRLIFKLYILGLVYFTDSGKDCISVCSIVTSLCSILSEGFRELEFIS